MSGPLPLRLDPYRLVGQEAHILGTVSLQSMARLKEATEGLATRDARVELWFFMDTPGRCTIRGNYHAEVIMTCQRCLQPADIDLHGNLELALIRPDDASDSLDGDHECFQLDRDGKLNTVGLIEEELLLSLPLIPVHIDKSDCDQTMLSILKKNSVHGIASTKQNPFAVLKGLKKNGSE